MDRVEKFKQLALKRFDALNLGKSYQANRCFDQLQKIAIDLYNNGEISALRPLLRHEHDAVRYEAAVKLLPFFTEESEEVLEELTLKKGAAIYSFAKIMLEEWHKGNVKFAYYKR